MPVLLLAQGDPGAKDLLRRSIEARYALSPPAIDAVKMAFTGRARVKVGPTMLWVPLQIQAAFRFPTALRWDFSVRPAGVPVQRGVEAFDGAVYRQARGRRNTSIIAEPAQVQSLRARLWAMAAVLLTPLGEHFVRLELQGERSFNATNTRLNDTVTLMLRADHTLESVRAVCLNPDNRQEQVFQLKLSVEQTPVDTIMVPARISAFWDDQPYYEVQPTHIENCTTIADDVFNPDAGAET